MTSYEDKLKSFVQYVKSQIEDYVPEDTLDEISDEDLMAAGRKNPETGKDFFSREQERHIIMECNSNESIYNTLGELKHISHVEEQERELVEEFLPEVRTITIDKNQAVLDLLKKFEKYTKNIKQDDLNNTTSLVISMFAHWVLEGEKYTVVEEAPLKFIIESESVCMGCLLGETLHVYKTFLGWAKHTYTGDVFDNIDTKEELFETFEIKAKDNLIDLLTALFTVRMGTVNGFMGLIGKNKTFSNLFYDLCEVLWCHIMSSSLISCWMFGKDQAQKVLLQKEEVKEILEGIHKHFVNEFQDCEKTNKYSSFIQNVKSYIHQFDKSQLILLSHYGFPFTMPKRLHNRIEKLIFKELQNKMEEK